MSSVKIVDAFGLVEDTIHGVTHTTVTHYDDREELSVIYIEGGTRKERVINLPEDGAVAYVMNNKGDTSDTYRWPRRGKIVSRPDKEHKVDKQFRTLNAGAEDIQYTDDIDILEVPDDV